MTKTEQAIQDLWRTVSKLEERIDSARSSLKDLQIEIKELEMRRIKNVDSSSEIDRRLALLEDKFQELKKGTEEKDRRHWTIVLAVIGCLLTLGVNLGLTYFRLNK